MATIATDDSTSSARGDSAYFGLPNELVRAANGRYPLNVRHPAPLDALRAEIALRRAEGAQRSGCS